MTRRMILTVSSLVVILALLLGASAVFANGHAKAGASASGWAATPASRLAAAGPPVSTRRFTLEFVDAELVDVFQALATQSGANVACSGSVKGKTTLRLRNVTLDQALNIVTKLNGLDYAWVDAAYVIGTPEEVRAMRVSDLRTQVVVLQNIRPEQAQEVLTKLTPDVTVSVQKGSRTILLLGTEASLAKAHVALAEMDRKPALPEPPTTQVVAIRYMKAEEAADNITAALPGVKVQPGTQPNSLLITADAMQWESIHSFLASADVPPAPSQEIQEIYYVKYSDTIELMATVYQLMGVDVGTDRKDPKINLEKAQAAGVTITLAPRSFTPTVQSTSGAGQTGSVVSAPQMTGGGGGASAGSSNVAGLTSEAAPITALIVSGAPYAVEKAMGLLEQLDQAPRQIHIVAMVTEVNRDDINQLGVDWFGLGGTGVGFNMGEVGATGELTADLTDTSPRGLQIGKIQRTPLQWGAAITALENQHRARVLSNPSVSTLDGRQTSLHTGQTIYYPSLISQNGTSTTSGVSTVDAGVRLVVNPRINRDGEITLTISPTVSTAQLGTAGLPIVNERAVVTTVRVKSGETAVLAGLVTDTEDVTVHKVPFLSEIPLIGELFKSRTKLPAHTEILIFVTPTILEDAA